MTAPVTFHASTFVSQSPVGGGVLDAPRSRDRRGALDAHVQRAQPHPCLPRCASLASTTQRMQSRGHSPRTFFTGAPTLPVHPRREGVEALPYGVWGRYPRLTRAALNPSLTPPATPQSRPFGPRQLPFQGSRGVGGVFRPCASNPAAAGFGLSLAAEGGLWYNTRRERDLLVQDL